MGLGKKSTLWYFLLFFLLICGNSLQASEKILRPEADSLVAPAPWTLTGSAWLLILSSDAQTAEEDGFTDGLPPLVSHNNLVMVVHYDSSPVGPYEEILFSPGMVASFSGEFASISRIYVSSQDSVYNGRRNWGIPKELADFQVDRNSKGETVRVTSPEGKHIATFKLSRKTGFPWSIIPSLPFSTEWVPGFLQDYLTGVQFREGQEYRFRVKASSDISFGSLDSFESNPEYFPDLNKRTVRMVAELRNIEFFFAPAVISSGDHVSEK